VTAHRAPALWLVALAVVAATGVTLLTDAQWGAMVLVLALGGAAVARVLGGGRRPEGIAVRAVWLDTVILLALAVGIALLSTTPGVAGGPGPGDLRGPPPADVQGRSVVSTSSS